MAGKDKQRDGRGYQIFFDQHNRRWGAVMDRNCKGGPAPVGAYEYVEHLQPDTRFPHNPPWLPGQAWLVPGDGNSINWNRLEIDYKGMLKAQRQAHVDYRNACITAAQEMNEDYTPGETPSPKVRRVVGPEPAPIEPIAAAMQENAWILGKTTTPHPRLAEILKPKSVTEDEIFLDGMDFSDEDEFPKHLGGPNWELSDGTRMQGNRQSAEKAQSALLAGV